MGKNNKRKYATNICGRRIKLARVEKGLNQLELAVLMNVEHGLRIDHSGVSSLENGERFVKDFEILEFAKALDKHPMWILFGDNIPEKYK